MDPVTFRAKTGVTRHLLRSEISTRFGRRYIAKCGASTVHPRGLSVEVIPTCQRCAPPPLRSEVEMSYPDPDRTSPETRARWHIERAVKAQSEAESDDWASAEEHYHLTLAANHAAIASALIALDALAVQHGIQHALEGIENSS